MTLRYLSVCSGIEAASVAWAPLGWSPFAFAEIEAFPCAVLAHHYGSNYAEAKFPRNGVPNFGKGLIYMTPLPSHSAASRMVAK